MKALKISFYLLLLLLIYIACDKEDKNVIPENKLFAHAGADQQVKVGSVVTLDGSASTDGNDKSFTYQWTFKSKPSESNTLINAPATVSPSFTPDKPGAYIISLKITQGLGFSEDEVIITATNPGPDEPTAVIINDHITDDLILENIFEDPSVADYKVINDINITAKLTIKPGVMVEFEADKSFSIFPAGTLTAIGTNEESIIFTGKNRTKGYWKGILFISNNPHNELKFTKVEYAGSNYFPDLPQKANVALSGNSYSGSALKVSHSTFDNSAGYGMYLLGKSSFNEFFNNVFSNNSSAPLFIHAQEAHKLDVTSEFSENNAINGVETGGTISESPNQITWSALGSDAYYHLSSDLSIESPLRIAEGVVLKMERGVFIKVTGAGYLTAAGFNELPITFTSVSKTPGNNWGGLFINTNYEQNKLYYSEISYAGYQEIPGINAKANVAVGPSGKLTLQNSSIKNGQGWGVIVKINEGAQINSDVISSNTFEELILGKINPTSLEEPEFPALSGEWVDWWSFSNGHYSIDETFYNRNTSTWFGGAQNPWSINPATGFGLKIMENGDYVWTIAEHATSDPQCGAYNAEYITGNLAPTNSHITFQENYWRSKFYNSCNPTQNGDLEVEPTNMILYYQISKLYDVWSGEGYWELKFTNADNSTFSYFKK